jgi:hypothetical protein
VQSNTLGNNNTAVGRSALFSNQAGGDNTAIGVNALQSNTFGNYNVAVGESALFGITLGFNNVAVGYQALSSNATNNSNIAVGAFAGRNLTGGANNIYIGYEGAGGGPYSESGTIRIGECSVLFGCDQNRFYAPSIGLEGVNGAQVLITSDGQLGVLTSSRQFKEDIQDMGGASARLRKLRPVTFHYKPGVAGANGQLQYGLIAEEVAAVYPELVERSADGEPFTVRYHVLAPMLLNELQRQDRRIEEQQQQIQAQEAKIGELQVQMAALALRLEEAGARRQ